jgi:hypothetical protein
MDEYFIYLNKKNIEYFLERPSLRATTKKINYKNLLTIIKLEEKKDYSKKKPSRENKNLR